MHGATIKILLATVLLAAPKNYVQEKFRAD
jgi:hypothetical protein